MKVILLQNVKKMGSKGTIVEVADGYANSYLIPRKLAKVASDSDQKTSADAQAKTAAKKNARDTQDKDLFARINKTKVSITAHANPNGHLFAAVKDTDITSQIPGLKPENVVLKGSIKEIGEYEVPIKIGENKGKIIAIISR